MLCGEGAQGIEIAGLAGDMDADYAPCLFGDGLGDRLGVDIVGVGVDVGEDGDAPVADDTHGGSGHGVRRDDDFVAGTDTGCANGVAGIVLSG